MLVLHPPKIVWPIAIIFSLIIFIVINLLNYSERTQNGALNEVQGVLRIQNLGKNRVLTFNGEGRSGVCKFDSCMKSQVVELEGEKVTVKIDQENSIYEIAAAGKVVFSHISSEGSGAVYPLDFIFPSLGLMACIVYIVFNRRDYFKK